MCSGLVAAARRLGFAAPSYPPTRLTSGWGKEACALLAALAGCAITRRRLVPGRPVYRAGGRGGSDAGGGGGSEEDAGQDDEEVGRRRAAGRASTARRWCRRRTVPAGAGIWSCQAAGPSTWPIAACMLNALPSPRRPAARRTPRS